MPRTTARVWQAGVGAQGTPSAVLLSPIGGALVTSPNIQVTWQLYPVTSTPDQYRVQLYSDSLGQTVVFDTQWVVSANKFATLATVSALTSNRTYYVRVFTHTTAGEYAETAIESFFFARPTSVNVLGLTARSIPGCYPTDRDNPAILVSWNALAAHPERFLTFEVRRRKAGSTAYTAIARTTVTHYWDANILPGCEYEYAVVWYGDDVTPQTLISTQQVPPARAKVEFEHVYIHEVGAAMTEFFRMDAESGSVDPVMDTAIAATWGRQRPSAFIGEAFSHKISLKGLDHLRRKPADWERVRRMLERQSTVGTTLCVRLGLDQEMYFAAMGARKGLEQRSWNADFDLIEIHYDEDLGRFTWTPVARSFLDLILSGNEITDATRALGIQGDGRAVPDSSTGIWEATTNLCTNGGFTTNVTGWASPLGGGGAQPTRVTTQAKFGTASCRVSATVQFDGAMIFFTPVNATTYTGSVWIKRTETVNAWTLEFDNGGSVTASAAIPQVLGWQRVSVTGTSTGITSTSLRVMVNDATPTAADIYIDGAQIEAQPFATPYVETDGGSAARVAARVQMPVTTIIDETQGWVAMRVRMGWTSATPPVTNPYLFLWGDSTTNLIAIYTSSTQVLLKNDATAGVAGQTVAQNKTWTAGDIVTVIGAWRNGNLYISTDGAAFAAAGSRSEIPVIVAASCDIGTGGTVVAASECDSDILWFACGTGTLTDADAATIHSFGNLDWGVYAFPGDCTGFWAANDEHLEVPIV